MKLTESEKQLILEKRAQEEKEMPKLVGTLKEDLYAPDEYRIEIPYLLSKSEKIKFISEIESSFKLVVGAGSKFVGFINDDGSESWFDDDSDYGIENMPAEWAKKHLINIKRINKPKK